MPAEKRWRTNKKAFEATQVAFELEQEIACRIHEMAARAGLSPSNQVRKLIGLPYSAPKRPRLSLSLSNEDYALLGRKYALDPQASLEIKRRIMEELLNLLEKD